MINFSEAAKNDNNNNQAQKHKSSDFFECVCILFAKRQENAKRKDGET